MLFSQDRLYQEALKYADFPHSFVKLQQRGHISNLLKVLYQLYKDEQESLIKEVRSSLDQQNRPDYSLNNKEIEVFNKLKVFREHLKITCTVLIDDIGENFQSYYVQYENKQKEENYHHQKILYQHTNQENELQFLPKTDYTPRSQLTTNPVTERSSQQQLYQIQGNGSNDLSQSQISHGSMIPNKIQVHNNNQKNSRNNHIQQQQSLPQMQRSTSSIIQSDSSPNRGYVNNTQKYLKNLKNKHSIDHQKTPRDRSPSNQGKHNLSIENSQSYQMRKSHINLPTLPLGNLEQQMNIQGTSFINNENNSSKQRSTERYQYQAKLTKENVMQYQKENEIPINDEDYSTQFNYFKSELEKLKGKQKTEFFNNMVYSGFSYPKGSQSFIKESRFRDPGNPSPGPAFYNVNNVESIRSSSRSSQSTGVATFGRAQRNSRDRDNSPGPCAYNVKYHLLS